MFFFAFLLTTAPASAQNPLRDSLSVASRALDLRPDSIDLRLRRAAWYVELEQWEDAKADYDRVLRSDGQNIAALYFRAYVNDRLGRYNFARMDYQNLLKLVPGNFQAQLGLVILNEKDKHLTEAMDGINRMVEQFADSAVVYAVRAGMESSRGQHLLAVYDFGEALLRDPGNQDYILGRCNSLIELGKKKEAERDLMLLQKLGVSRAALTDFYDRIKKRK